MKQSTDPDRPEAGIVRIKPHHFVDILTAFGDGRKEFRAHPYGHALHLVAERILSADDTPLLIDLGADDICRPCRHNLDGLCDDIIDVSFRPGAPESKSEYNLIIDRRWCERLGLEPGERITAQELSRRILDRAGDLTPIYCETPAGRTAERAAKLFKGVKQFLNGERIG